MKRLIAKAVIWLKDSVSAVQELVNEEDMRRWHERDHDGWGNIFGCRFCEEEAAAVLAKAYAAAAGK